MSVQRERSQRMDVLTTLLIGLMALFGEVPQPEVDRVCEEREVAVERALEGCVTKNHHFHYIFLKNFF